MRNNYTVYMHIAPNGKKYIGITQQSLERRWQNGKAYKSNKYFTNAVNKYGWDSIKHIILYTNLTKEEAEQKEIELIAKYKSNNSKYGYNIESGGNATKKLSETTKQKLSLAHKGKKRPPFSEEHRKKMSIAKLGKKGIPMKEETKMKLSIIKKGHIVSNETKEKIRQAHLGYHHTDEARKRISEGHKGQIAWNKGIPMSESMKKRISIKMCKLVKCIETNTIYYGIREAQRKTGINGGNISAVCLGNKKMAGGYHWKYILSKK